MDKINLNDLKCEVFVLNEIHKCIATLDSIQVCKCQINANVNTWTISAWYTDKNYLNQGIGTKTLTYLLKFLYDKLGMPKNIEYIWNGANEYVYEWIEKNFDAVSNCPIAVQKTQCEDDWNSHIYNLNVEKVIKYFKLI